MPKFSVSTGAASYFEAFSRPLQKSRGARSWEPKRREKASKKEAAPVLTENFGITREYQLHLQGGSQLGSPIFLLPRPYTRTGHAHTHTKIKTRATRRRHRGRRPRGGGTPGRNLARGLPRGESLLFLPPRPHTRTGQAFTSCVYAGSAAPPHCRMQLRPAPCPPFARGLPTWEPLWPGGPQLGSPPAFAAPSTHKDGAAVYGS